MTNARRAAAVAAFTLAAFVAGDGAGARSNPPADIPSVTTLAGSGAPGISDGSGLKASFVAPMGLTFSQHGRLYVADRGAQRVRAVAPDGTVTTVAGSGSLDRFGLGVQGGYRDGPAARARFDRPSAIAVAADGAIFVADTGNRAIRKIARGEVTTFAGAPGPAARLDGPRTNMRFASPTSLAFDAAGNLYVADFGNGIRKISPDGTGSTLFRDPCVRRYEPDDPISPLGCFSRHVISLAYLRDGDEYLFLANVAMLRVYNLTSGSVERVVRASEDRLALPPTEGASHQGPFAAVAAFNSDEWLSADPLRDTVDLHQSPAKQDAFFGLQRDYVRQLTAENRSELDSPLGVAIAPGGAAIAVADTGGRRVRIMGAFDHRSGGLQCCASRRRFDDTPTAPSPDEYRIALLGPSYAWYNTTFSESVGGRVEAALNRLDDFHGGTRRVRVYPMRFNAATLYDLMSYARNAASGAFDTVIVLANSAVGKRDGVEVSLYDDVVGRDLAQLDADLQRDRTKLLLVPYLDAYFPNEGMYNRIPREANNRYLSDDSLPYLPAVGPLVDAMLGTVRGSGVDYADAISAFLDEQRKPEHRALFGPFDPHFTVHGNEVLANAIVARLRQLRPWQTR